MKAKSNIAKSFFPTFEDAKFRTLIEKSFDVITVINAKGEILYASPSIVRLYGRSYEEILGVSGLKYIHPFDLPRITKLLTKIILHPKEPIETDLRIKHKNGNWMWVRCIATNLLHDKNINGIVVNFFDFTELKKLDERKNEFISIVSHELKTPITLIKANTQLLKKIYSGKDKQLINYLVKIEAQTNGLIRMINELLDVSRIVENKIIIRKQKFIMEDLINNVITEIIQLNNRRNIIFKNKTKTVIHADKQRISQVLINLLTNAIKYSPSGTDIIVKCKTAENQICIIIKDFGIGIPKSKINKIFERFYQESKYSEKVEGLGLGLYITSNLIKLHKGKITIKSSEDKGTEFSVWLPK